MNVTAKLKHRQPLGPNQLRVAGKAFEQALEHCAEVESDMHPLAIRKVLASAIMQEVLVGEEDVERLKGEALEQLARIAHAQTFRAGNTTAVKLEIPRKSLG